MLVCFPPMTARVCVGIYQVQKMTGPEMCPCKRVQALQGSTLTYNLSKLENMLSIYVARKKSILTACQIYGGEIGSALNDQQATNSSVLLTVAGVQLLEIFKPWAKRYLRLAVVKPF